MKIYLSGPMRHWPDFNIPAFDALAARLRGEGHEVFNPGELPLDWKFAEYMKIDLPAVLSAEAVMVLPDWDCSQGALLEVMTARAIGIKVVNGIWAEVPLCPAEVANRSICQTMRIGRQKHPHGTWRHETATEHILKAARHLLTAQLRKMDLTPDDGEDHLVNATCRTAMAMAVTPRHCLP